VSSTELPDPDPTLSLDAAHSSYAPASATKEAQNPPPGPSVEQTLGTPTAPAATKKSSSSS